jgi:hypothetical protein
MAGQRIPRPHDDHVVADAMPEGAASLEVITPKLVSAPSWSIEIGSAHPAGWFAERRKPGGAGPFFRGTRSADHAGRRLQAPMRRLGLGLGLAVDMNLGTSGSAAERAVGSARLRKVCPLRTRWLLCGPGPRIEGDFGAGHEWVRLVLLGCRCLGFVHGGDPFRSSSFGQVVQPKYDSIVGSRTEVE